MAEGDCTDAIALADLEPSLANIPGSVEPERKEHTSQDVPALESHQTADGTFFGV